MGDFGGRHLGEDAIPGEAETRRPGEAETGRQLEHCDFWQGPFHTILGAVFMHALS